MSNRDDLNASPLCGKCKGVAHLKRLHIKTKWYDVMSTTTDDVRVDRPLRRLIITSGPKEEYFMGCIAANLFCHGFVFTFIMDKELPSGMKPQAQNRHKFHLRMLFAGDASGSKYQGEFRIVCILQDIAHPTDPNKPKAVNYFYAGVYNCRSTRGFLDEFSHDGFMGNPLIWSLYPDRFVVFESLDQQ